MINEEVRSKNVKLVAEIKAEVERIQRVRNAAPQMLEALKHVWFAEEDEICWNVVQDAICAAEGDVAENNSN